MSRSWHWWMKAYERMQTIHLSRDIQVTPFQAMEMKWYILGDLPPHYPLPTTIGIVRFDSYPWVWMNDCWSVYGGKDIES